MLSKHWFSFSLIFLLTFLYFYLLVVPINMATADLGRHIKNGEELLAGNFNILYKNYYSYTHPEFKFINHHWLGGVIFYLTSILSGFAGIQLLFITLNLVAFFIFFLVSKKYSNIIVSSITALIIIPVIAYRQEVRPEAFSYLFAAVYYFLCKEYFHGKLKNKIYFLPLLQIIWANIHIYFFIGIFIIGSFWIKSLIIWFMDRGKGSWKILKNMTLVGVLSVAASLLNPNFTEGLVYPLTILNNYGYRVLENQSIFFLENIISVPVVIYLKMTLGLLILSWIYKFYRVIRIIEDFNFEDLIITIGICYLSLTQIRNAALFGFFALPIISINLKSLKLEASKYLIYPALGIIFIAILVVNPSYWENRNFGLGLAPGIEKAAEFFKDDHIKGPIFNNYDLGGYLIYYLSPREKVFVDNRPEGYPIEFFEKTYVPMQENENIWKAKLVEYNFNSIFFYRQDLTPWAQKFLIERIKDPEWAPVFVDDYNIIFIKRNSQNEETIKKNELPKETFKTDQ